MPEEYELVTEQVDEGKEESTEHEIEIEGADSSDDEQGAPDATVRRRSTRSRRAYHTTISQYKQHRKFLKILHDAAPIKITRRRRRTGEIVMLSKPKIQSKHKGDPRSVKEAMRSADSSEWMKAKEAEDKSLDENGTWIRVEE